MRQQTEAIPRSHALVIVGTRPEAIKLAPVVVALRRTSHWHATVVATGQHGPVVAEALAHFGLVADLDLGAWDRSDDLIDLYLTLTRRISTVIDQSHPDLVVVQGDTASTLAGAMAAFWRSVPVAHVEAGLRSGDLHAPFPEEANRRMVSQIADLHLAPTSVAAEALAHSGISPSQVVVTGNTVVDAVTMLADANPLPEADATGAGRRLVLVTCHRRENWGEPMREIARALRRLVASDESVEVVLAAHPNPAVRVVLDEVLSGIDRVVVRDAVPYPEFLGLLRRAAVVVSDSGGVQEEAPAFGVPVLVLRDTTERTEGLTSGAARLVGTNADDVLREIHHELHIERRATRSASAADNPYGDGHAAARCVAAFDQLLGHEDRAAMRTDGASVQPNNSLNHCVGALS